MLNTHVKLGVVTDASNPSAIGAETSAFLQLAG